jgi:2-polyprenyl-6-methoxyphenol hydroxylase-like FAD-dependent oxidoreductase
MSSLGHTAVVIGAGVGGLAAAGALHPFYERVVVLDRDELPDGAAHRPSIPQGKHLHILLGGGQRALGRLFPGFESDLSAAGAVRANVARDQRTELVGYDPFPQRDLQLHTHYLSRPLLDSCLRKRVRALHNVVVEPRSAVKRIVATDGRVTGVVRTRGPHTEELPADLVIEASGRGQLTLDLLAQVGVPAPAVSVIGVDIGYACAVFALPHDAVPWKQAATFPAAPHASCGAMMVANEGGRWIVSACGRAGEYPTADPVEYMAFLRGLRTQTIHDALRYAERVGDIELFRFSESRWRHFERYPAFPAGLLPIADTICRFNPIYGQGMTVAAKQAVILAGLLQRQANAGGRDFDLATQFFEAASEVVEDAWSMSANRDLMYPQTRGERPADFARSLKFSGALNALAARDPELHKLVSDVRHMLKPNSALQEQHVMERVRAFMAA